MNSESSLADTYSSWIRRPAAIGIAWLGLAAGLFAPELKAAAPVITSFTPASARAGASVSLTGTDLITVTNVQFGGVTAKIRFFGNLLFATVPPDAVSGPITVKNPEGTGTSATAFTVLPTPAPVITAFTPASGSPGSQVSISGANLAGATVKFNGVQATEVVAIDTEISATIPSGATTGIITVTTVGGTASSATAFVVTGAALPVILDFNPKTGASGTTVSITGQNMDNVTAVSFNGIAAASFTVFGGAISAKVPAGATTGPISVTTSGGTGTSSASFTVAAGASPQITSFNPTSGPPASSVAIRGANLNSVTRVLFNGVSASFLPLSAAEISASVPEGATTGLITLESAAGTNSSTTVFTVTGPMPVISDFAPDKGGPGTLTVIAGSRFVDVVSVAFNGVNAEFQVLTTNQIVATAPAGVSSGPITVTTLAGAATSSRPFYAQPRIDSFNPTLAAAGAVVRLKGANFRDASAVRLGDLPLVFQVVSNTDIDATISDAAASGLLTIDAPAGSATSQTPLAIGPSIRGISPTAGQPGTLVVIRGTAFSGTTNVTFGGASAQNVTVVSATEIHATVPTSAATGPLTVSTPVGMATSAEPFVVGLELTEFAPTGAPAETVVVIRGAGFSGITAVRFNGLAAEYTLVSPAEIRATVPKTASTGPISLDTPDGTAVSRSSFVVIPKIASFSPAVGKPGDIIVLTGTGFSGVVDSAIGLARAFFQIDSPTQMRITVPDTASTASILLTAPGANAPATIQVASPEPFIIGAAADLTLSVTATPPQPKPGGNVTLTFVLKNLGSSTATNAYLTNVMPASATFVNSFPPVAPAAGGVLAMALGNLTSGQSTFATVTFQTPTAGFYTNTAAASSRTSDPASANNSLVTIVDVSDPVPPTLAIQIVGNPQGPSALVRLSWPASASSYKAQSRASLTAGDWADIATNPALEGDQLVLIESMSPGDRYYRLVRP